MKQNSFGAVELTKNGVNLSILQLPLFLHGMLYFKICCILPNCIRYFAELRYVVCLPIITHILRLKMFLCRQLSKRLKSICDECALFNLPTLLKLIVQQLYCTKFRNPTEFPIEFVLQLCLVPFLFGTTGKKYCYRLFCAGPGVFLMSIDDVYENNLIKSWFWRDVTDGDALWTGLTFSAEVRVYTLLHHKLCWLDGKKSCRKIQ